jgi:hypothetical protein
MTWAQVKRALIAVGLGLLLSVAYNAIAIAVVEDNQRSGNWLPNLLFGPGLFLANLGFASSHMSPIINNVLLLFVAFSLFIWILQGRRVSKPNDNKFG